MVVYWLYYRNIWIQLLQYVITRPLLGGGSFVPQEMHKLVCQPIWVRYHLTKCAVYPETGGYSLLWNVGNCLQHQTSWCNWFRRSQCTFPPPLNLIPQLASLSLYLYQVRYKAIAICAATWSTGFRVPRTAGCISDFHNCSSQLEFHLRCLLRTMNRYRPQIYFWI